MAVFYTYIHTRADDGKVFYVGKGKGERASSRRGRNAHWHRTANKHGLCVEIVAHWPSEREAFEHEKALISLYRGMNISLCNLTDGGDGPSGYRHRPDTRAKFATRKNSEAHRASISAANTGLVRSQEFRAKIVAALTGRPVSAETRAKMSAAHKGRVISQEWRDKIAKTLTGRRLSENEKARLAPLTHSAEWRSKRSASMKGRPLSDELLAAIKGKPWTPARRAAQNNKAQP